MSFENAFNDIDRVMCSDEGLASELARMQKAFQRIRTGSTVPHRTCKMVNELMLDVPHRDVQNQIMAQANGSRARTEIAKNRYEAIISDITALPNPCCKEPSRVS